MNNVHGIVYAVKIKPEWIKNADKLDNSGLDKELAQTLRDDLRQKSDILPSSIIARIESPNGISDYLPNSGDPIPVPWRKDEFFKYISELSSFHITSEKRKKLLLLKDM